MVEPLFVAIFRPDGNASDVGSDWSVPSWGELHRDGDKKLSRHDRYLDIPRR